MDEKFKILTEFVKDSSCETPDVETYLYVKEYLKNFVISKRTLLVGIIMIPVMVIIITRMVAVAVKI